MLRGNMGIHNYFFYFKNTKPWEATDAVQDKGAKRSGKKRQKVGGTEKAPDESKSDSASESADG